MPSIDIDVEITHTASIDLEDLQLTCSECGEGIDFSNNSEVIPCICNEEYWEDRGYEAGREYGFDEGYEEGFKDGVKDSSLGDVLMLKSKKNTEEEGA